MKKTMVITILILGLVMAFGAFAAPQPLAVSGDGIIGIEKVAGAEDVVAAVEKVVETGTETADTVRDFAWKFLGVVSAIFGISLGVYVLKTKQAFHEVADVFDTLGYWIGNDVNPETGAIAKMADVSDEIRDVLELIKSFKPGDTKIAMQSIKARLPAIPPAEIVKRRRHR